MEPCPEGGGGVTSDDIGLEVGQLDQHVLF
jgi:hypothetical protein